MSAQTYGEAEYQRREWTLTVGDVTISTANPPHLLHRVVQRILCGFEWKKSLGRPNG